MIRFLFLLCFLIANFTFAKSFERLESKRYFTHEFIADKDCAVKVKLMLNQQKSTHQNIPLQVMYAIDEDTIIEYYQTQEVYSKTFKTLNLKSNQKLSVGLKVVHADSIIVKRILGDLTLIETDWTDNYQENTSITYLGNFVQTSETQILKLDYQEDESQNLLINIHNNAQFLQDSLHVQVSYLLPNGAFGTEGKSFEINPNNKLAFTSQQNSIEFPNIVKQKGVYVFQVKFLNQSNLLNGITKIELTTNN